MHCRMFSSMPDLQPLDASSTFLPCKQPKMSPNMSKCSLHSCLGLEQLPQNILVKTVNRGPTVLGSGPKSDSYYEAMEELSLCDHFICKMERRIDLRNRSTTAQFSGSVHLGTCIDLLSSVTGSIATWKTALEEREEQSQGCSEDWCNNGCKELSTYQEHGRSPEIFNVLCFF